MDSISPIAARIAGQMSFASGSSCKPSFGMGFLTLVENLFVGRRWLLGCDGCGLDANGSERTPDHRRYREYHYRSAGGYGQAS